MAELQLTEVVTDDDLQDLLADRQGPIVSLYQPTDRTDVDGANVVRFKNLVSSAGDRLEELGYKGGPIAGQLRLLVERSDFWRRPLDGLAIFAAPDYLRAFKLPVTFDELVVVGNTAHVTPLIPALAAETFYVLAISQGSARLVNATRYEVEEIDLSDLNVPTSLDEAMRYDDFEKSNLERHPVQQRGNSGGRTLQHGHGPGEADIKNEITRYFQAVDDGISKLLRASKSPLVLAAVDYLIPIYKQISKYPHVLDAGLEGNPDQLSPSDLAGRARPLVEPHLREGIDRASERWGNAIGTGLASCDLAEVLSGAYGGRVDTLLVCKGEQRWGIFDPGAGSVEVREQPEGPDVDLVDLGVRLTMQRGGAVYVVQPDRMPCDEALAATFRY